MKRERIVITFLAAFLAASRLLQGAEAAKPTPKEVKALGAKVAAWQMSHTKDDRRPQNWLWGALYAGMWEFSTITKRDTYIKWLKTVGERNNWELAPRMRHADDHAVGQLYLNLYRRFGDPEMLKPTQAQFDSIIADPRAGTLKWRAKNTDALHRWGWCDALFMAPPVWARLASITGDKKYLTFMDEEYHATYDLLWDKEEHLFWRDSSFFKTREKNGRKMFWSRGNGWVMGGLALMIPDLPKDWEGRAFYVDVFRKMAAKLKDIQRPDGTWSMGLLGSVEDYPTIETSGTAFITFGLAWGINAGLLDRAAYEPVVLKAWQALASAVQDDGFLGYVQPVGAAPGRSRKDGTAVYGVGAFLAAAAEVYKLVGGQMPEHETGVSASQSKSSPAPAPCFARYVPERLDDFAWENDRIAFRMYGPALWKQEADKCGSGIDVWVKKVRYPIINKWYRSGHYHKDTGEGADLYNVGTSRGCGGTAIWRGGTLHTSANWVAQKVIKGEGDVIAFTLTYAPWKAGNITVSETKRVSMKAGTNFFKVESTFNIDGADEATVAIGIVLRGTKGELKHGANWMSYAEPNGKNNGTTFCGVILPRGGTFKKAAGHGLLLTPVSDRQTLTYYAGSGWSKGLNFKNHGEWLDYVRKEAKVKAVTTK